MLGYDIRFFLQAAWNVLAPDCLTCFCRWDGYFLPGFGMYDVMCEALFVGALAQASGARRDTLACITIELVRTNARYSGDFTLCVVQNIDDDGR